MKTVLVLVATLAVTGCTTWTPRQKAFAAGFVATSLYLSTRGHDREAQQPDVTVNGPDCAKTSCQ